jgi:hypothetical protein
MLGDVPQWLILMCWCAYVLIFEEDFTTGPGGAK